MKAIISPQDAVAMVKPGMTLAVDGFVAYGSPEELLSSLRRRFLETGEPRDLTLVYIAGHGDGGKRGVNHLALEGLIRRTWSPHMGGLCPAIGDLAAREKIESFMVPQGVSSHMMRAIAGQRIGVITTVGVGTFMDPRLDGGKINESARKSGHDHIELLDIKGIPHLLYKAFSIDVCFIKASYADEDGNLSLEKEACVPGQLEMAMATRNSGGIVLAEAGRIVKRGTLNPHNVAVAGIMVDYVVECTPENNRQSLYFDEYRPELCGEIRVPVSQALTRLPLNDRKVIGRRGAMELQKGTLVNLGLGIPSYVGDVATEEGLVQDLTFTIESGILGGVPLGGTGIGGAINPEAIYKHPDMFDAYDGGALDLTCLGAAEISAAGDVNVSRFGGRVVGPGGFINISQGAKKVCFCGTFTSGKSVMEIKNGRLNIIEDGNPTKFVQEVEQITFSGSYAASMNKTVLYITERAVFRLTPKGLMLVEIAPGVDLEQHILAKMGFTPLIAEDLKEMDARLFRDASMGLCFETPPAAEGQEKKRSLVA